MAKTKGKAKIAASNVPSQMEAVSGNDMIAESAPSESVEIEEAATTMVLDKSEEVDNKEETSDGPDESLEVDETEEKEVGLDEPEEVDDVEENENGLDKSENEDGLDKSEHGNKMEEPTDALDKLDEGDKEEETKEDGEEESLATDVPEGEEVEETDVTGEAKDNDKGNAPNKKNESRDLGKSENEDGLDKSEHGDKIEESTNVVDKSDEGDKEEETKEDGKEESLATDVPEGEEVEETDVTGEAKDNDKGENAPNKKTKKMRRKKAAAAAANDAKKSSDADKQKISAAEKDSKMAEETIEGGKDKSLATYVPEGEEVEKRDVTGEAKDNGKGENAPNKKAKRMRRRKKKNGAAAGAANDASKSNDADKRGTSTAEKDSKMADGMGLIFMCNAKTKNDCFHYKVFGLPASKKEMVAKVYKGMKLFLFDIDLKLMYGIYKAADSGGYNIEPKAFKSAFPSQVRLHTHAPSFPSFILLFLRI